MRSVVALLLALGACSTQDEVAFGQGGTNPLPVDAGPQPEYCRPDGPPLPLVGDGLTVGDKDAGAVCSGQIAQYSFKKALCTCELYETATALTTQTIDSTSPGTPAPDAPVGINGTLAANGLLTIGGDLTVGSAAAFRPFATGSQIAGDVAIGGSVGESPTNLSVGGDMAVNGTVALGQLTVGGILTVPTLASLGTTQVTADEIVEGTVGVDPPCACGANDLVDIAAFVAAHEVDNDNPAVPAFDDGTGTPKTFSSGVLAGFVGNPVIELPCGRFYLDGISGTGNVTFLVNNKAALLIGGDVDLNSKLQIFLVGDNAELDLMVGGNFSSKDTSIGDSQFPRRTRIYVNGQDRFQITGVADISANIYAPKARLEFTGGGTLYGSLFVRQFVQAAELKILYDIAVRRLPTDCIL